MPPRPRLAALDRALLWVLLPLFALILGLHLRQVALTGVALPPVFAVSGAGPDAYPTVGGQRLERGREWNALELGDTLLRVGDADLAGVGYFGFDAVALEQAGRALEAPLVFERGGEPHEVVLRMQRHGIPWFMVPVLVCYVLVAIVVLLRGAERRQARLFFAGFTGFAICELHFYGGPAWQTLASYALFQIGVVPAVVAILRWVILFPNLPDEKRLSMRWSWVPLVLYWSPINYYFGGPVPPPLVPTLLLGIDAVVVAMILVIVLRNMSHASRSERRRVRWPIVGALLGNAPVVALLLTVSLAPGLVGPHYGELFQIANLFTLAIPISLLIGIVQHNLFDVDRLLSSTATWGVSLAVALGAFVTVVPAFADGIAATTGLGTGGVRLGLFALIVVAAVPLAARLRPRIEDLLLPGRSARAQGFDLLLADLSAANTEGEVLRLLGGRLAALLDPETCVVYTVGEGSLGVENVRAPEGTPPLERDSALLSVLEATRMPLLLTRETELDEPTCRVLETLRAEIAAPVRCGTDLVAVVVLGPQCSGDAYYRTDVTLLGAVAQRASDRLLALEDRETIAWERGRAERIEGEKGRVQASHESRSRGLAAASHDVRQSLHALGLFVEGLDRQAESDGLRDLVGKVRSSTEALGGMFEGLLDLSRIDVGAIAPDVRPFPLGPALERLGSEMDGIARRKGLELRLPACDLEVESDPVLLSRILQNLLANAIRYTERGRVELRVHPEEGDVAIEVRDTGPGIPRELQGEIFEEFVRYGEGGHRSLGLGLAIVRRLADLLGHAVALDSVPGRGTTFRITVPLAREHAPAEAVGAPASLRGRCILVIDDDLAILDGMGRVLEDWGCEVILAASAADALESIEHDRRFPDAILADYGLAEGTGVQAIAAVEQLLGRPVPALLISGDSAIEPGDLAAHRLITKPAHPAELKLRLAELLEAAAPPDRRESC